MVKQVKWTSRSINDRVSIYKYWQQHNRSTEYSDKLELLFEKSANLISKFPHIGIKTGYRNVYSKVVRQYKLFYRIQEEEIQILRVWDTRQDPSAPIV